MPDRHPDDMTPSMKAAAMLGVAERELRTSMADSVGLTASLRSRIDTYISAVDDLLAAHDENADTGEHSTAAGEWVAYAITRIDAMTERADRAYVSAMVAAKNADTDARAARTESINGDGGWVPGFEQRAHLDAMANYTNLASALAAGVHSIVTMPPAQITVES